MSPVRVGELELYIDHHNIVFKGKKDEKVRVLKANITSKVLSSIVQDSQNNIQPASFSNSESDSDGIERILRAPSNSSEQNDSVYQAGDG